MAGQQLSRKVEARADTFALELCEQFRVEAEARLDVGEYLLLVV